MYIDLLPYFIFRERVPAPKEEPSEQKNEIERRSAAFVATTLQSPPKNDGSENSNTDAQNGHSKPGYSARSLLKSASISASKCIGVKNKRDVEVNIHS